MLTEDFLTELAKQHPPVLYLTHFARAVEREALEHAWRVCIDVYAQGRDAGACADAIRALIDKEPRTC